MSKVVRQLLCRIEALQGSKIILKQPWGRRVPKVVNDHTPIVNKMNTNYGFKRWPSAKSKDDPVPSQHQGVSDWTQGPRLPTKVSFKGGSHLGNSKSYFISSLSNLGDEISLRVVVCNIPIFYQILGWNFCFLFCLCWLKIYRKLKLLSLFKRLY
jgi:hypothetical protein